MTNVDHLEKNMFSTLLVLAVLCYAERDRVEPYFHWLKQTAFNLRFLATFYYWIISSLVAKKWAGWNQHVSSHVNDDGERVVELDFYYNNRMHKVTLIDSGIHSLTRKQDGFREDRSYKLDEFRWQVVNRFDPTIFDGVFLKESQAPQATT